MVHLRVPDMAYKQAESFSKKFGFGSVQEYTREALRRMNEEYDTMLAIRKLEKLKGSVPGAKQISREERRMIAEQFIKKSAKERSDLFRRVGLD